MFRRPLAVNRRLCLLKSPYRLQRLMIPAVRGYSMDLGVRVFEDGAMCLTSNEVAGKRRVSRAWMFARRRRERSEIGP